MLTLFAPLPSVSNIKFEDEFVCWFANTRRNGFKNTRSLKDHLIKSVLLGVGVVGNTGICSWKRPRELYQLPKKSLAFKKRNFDEIYHINEALNCDSEKTVYFLECNEFVANCLLEAPRPNFVIELTPIKVTHQKFRNKAVSQRSIDANNFPQKI